MGEELLAALVPLIAPVDHKDHGARVGAFMRDLLTAVPALQTQTPLDVERRSILLAKKAR